MQRRILKLDARRAIEAEAGSRPPLQPAHAELIRLLAQAAVDAYLADDKPAPSISPVK